MLSPRPDRGTIAQGSRGDQREIAVVNLKGALASGAIDLSRIGHLRPGS
jgi:hypothetical protein